MVKLASKRYRAAAEPLDPRKRYTLAEALDLLANMPKAKFDETVELSMHMGLDPRQSDQMVRGVINLPHGSGKTVRVIAFTEDPEAAKAAGADEAGLDDLIKRVQEGWLDFDTAIATTTAMKSVRQVARVLGPRGLMPNPKSGTVTDDIAGALKDIKQGGRVEFKMDKTANIAIIVGKRSFSKEALEENINEAIGALKAIKPEGAKGKTYVRSMAVTATMSPGIKLDGAVYPV